MLQDSQTNDGGGPSTPEVDPDLQRMQTDYKDAIVGIGMADFSGATDYINRYGNPNVQVSRIKQNEDGTISMWRGNPGSGGSVSMGDETIDLPEGKEDPTEIKFSNPRDFYAKVLGQMKPAGSSQEIAAGRPGKFKTFGSKEAGWGVLNEETGATTAPQHGIGYKPDAESDTNGVGSSAERQLFDDTNELIYRDMINFVADEKGLVGEAADDWITKMMATDDNGNLKIDKDRFVKELDNDQRQVLQHRLSIGQMRIREKDTPAMAAQIANRGQEISQARDPEAVSQEQAQQRYSQAVAQIPATPEGAQQWVERARQAANSPEELNQMRARLRQINPQLLLQIRQLEQSGAPIGMKP